MAPRRITWFSLVKEFRCCFGVSPSLILTGMSPARRCAITSKQASYQSLPVKHESSFPSPTESPILWDPVSCARSLRKVFAVCVSSERSFSCIFSIPEKMSETGIAERWDFTLFCEDFRAFGNMCYTHKNGVFDRNGDVLKWMSN